MDGRRARRMTNHQNILAAARVMIDEGGLENLSMRALAEKVGVSVTTLYNLFDTREAIVRAALDQVLAEITPIVGSLQPSMIIWPHKVRIAPFVGTWISQLTYR